MELYGLVISPGDYESEDLRNILEKMRPRDHVDLTSNLWPRWLTELIRLRDTHDIVHAKDKISIGVILFAWILHIVFWYLAAVYLDNVHPGKFGSAKPWYYLCKVNDENLAINRKFDAIKSSRLKFVKLTVRFRNQLAMRTN